MTDNGALEWRLSVPGHAERTVTIEAVPVDDGVAMQLRHPRGHAVDRTLPAKRMRKWRQRGPQVRTPDRNLAAGARPQRRRPRRAAHLRPRAPALAGGRRRRAVVHGPVRPGLAADRVDAAALGPGPALGTLRTLAAWQGSDFDAASEEEPGKILHEVRFGPAASFALGGRSAYYGSADATPLFVMLLGELQRWGGKDNAVDALLPHADRALEWIESLRRRRRRRLRRVPPQDRSRPGQPGLEGLLGRDQLRRRHHRRAAHRARRGPGLRLRRLPGPGSAGPRMPATIAAPRHWRKKAKQLKRDFNERFWLPDKGWYAIGLDGDKRPIDSLTSNIGHCLWTGIADKDKASAVARHLMSPEMFSGWGIRTLASSMARLQPDELSQRLGLAARQRDLRGRADALRLRRAGPAGHGRDRRRGGARSAYRLPELFCGFDRARVRRRRCPTRPPARRRRGRPAAPLLLLHSLLRFTPDVDSAQLWCAPEVPERYLPLRVSGLRVAKSRLAVDVGAGSWEITGLEPVSIEIIPTAQAGQVTVTGPAAETARRVSAACTPCRRTCCRTRARGPQAHRRTGQPAGPRRAGAGSATCWSCPWVRSRRRGSSCRR